MKKLLICAYLTACGNIEGGITGNGPVLVLTKSGPEGPKGKDGVDGNQGPKGEPGPTGEAGKDGKQGPQGTEGKAGTNGEAGPAGPEGSRGPQGPSGQLSVVIGQGNLSDCEHGYTLFGDGTLILEESSHSASSSNSLGSWRVPLSVWFSVIIGSSVKCTNMHYEIIEGEYLLFYTRISNSKSYKFKLNEFNPTNNYSDRSGAEIRSVDQPKLAQE